MPSDWAALLDVSHLLTLLTGVIIGAGGQYLADRFTDQRRAQESRSKAIKQFDEIKAVMPNLLAEMSKDVKGDPSQSVRELVLIPNNRYRFNGNKPRFIYSDILISEFSDSC